MARDWRCLIGRHDWQTVETADRDKHAESSRCRKSDWRRVGPRTSGTWRGTATCPRRRLWRLEITRDLATRRTKPGDSAHQTWRFGAPNLATRRTKPGDWRGFALATGKLVFSGDFAEVWGQAESNIRDVRQSL